MIKIINEKNENSKEIEKWSNKFVQDIMNDPEIKELSKLPDNKYGEKAVSFEVVNSSRTGSKETMITFDSYGNGGEFQIEGFDEDGNPYFLEDDSEDAAMIPYEEMLEIMKSEIKGTIKDEQKYAKEREEKLANAKERFSKMSQKEKDNIVMNYLMNN